RLRLAGVGAAEDGARVGVDVANPVAIAPAATEVGTIAIVDDGEDAAAHRHPRRAPVPRLLPRRPVDLDLLALLDVERLAALVVLQRRALQVHAQARRPPRRRIRAGSPPDAFAQPCGMR